MNHDEVVAEIQRRAKSRHVLSHYCRRGERCDGDPGQPDLLLVGDYYVGWIEVKMPPDKRSSEQVEWYHKLRASGQLYETMCPADLDDGSVDLFLQLLAEG